MSNEKPQDGSLDLADINFEPAPGKFIPEIVELEGNAHDKDDDPNG